MAQILVHIVESEYCLQYTICTWYDKFAWLFIQSQAAALIADDMMDESETRRGKRCWHLAPDVGTMAINDCFMLENAAYFLMRKAIGDDDCYVRIFNFIHETSLQTIFEQCLDTKTGLTCDISS